MATASCIQILGVGAEPVAAALAYGIHGGTDGDTVLVVDVGGGTFDVRWARDCCCRGSLQFLNSQLSSVEWTLVSSYGNCYRVLQSRGEAQSGFAGKIGTAPHLPASGAA